MRLTISLTFFILSGYILMAYPSPTPLSFAIIADPQLNAKSNPGTIGNNSALFLKKAVREINASDNNPSFVVFLGDLVNVFNEGSVAHFKECIKDLEPEPVIVNGNHDTRPPFAEFLKLTDEISGRQEVFYSFDRSGWHFIILPCDLRGNNPATKEITSKMFVWLERDLDDHKDVPTVIFEHFPLLPQGLSQFEWYTFHLEERLRLLDLITTHGKVKYYFNGHVHNGIKASEKLSWTYKDVNFITVPSMIKARNFGEEYNIYREGLDRGGFYMMVEAGKDELRLTCRLAGIDNHHHLSGPLQTFTAETEPRWLSTIPELQGNAQLLNGSFDNSLSDWMVSYRYKKDNDPLFIMDHEKETTRAGNGACRLMTKTEERSVWSDDEFCKIYQMIEIGEIIPGSLTFSYLQKESPVNGGFLVHITAFKGLSLEKMIIYSSGDPVEESNHLIRSMDYEINGNSSTREFLEYLKKTKKLSMAVLENSNNQWKTEKIDIKSCFYTAPQKGINDYKLCIAFIAWAKNLEDSFSEVFIDEVMLE